MIAISRNRPELHAGWEAVLDSDERAIWKWRSDGANIWMPNAVLSVFMGVSLWGCCETLRATTGPARSVLNSSILRPKATKFEPIYPIRSLEMNAVSSFATVPLCFISLFWLAGSLPFLFELIGYYLLAIGAYRIIYPTYWSAYRRKRSLYILTDRRAIIMMDFPILGNYTNSYPIDESTYLEFDSKDPGSIFFSIHYPNKPPMGYHNSEGSMNSILSSQVFGGYDPAYRTGLAVRPKFSTRIIQWFCNLLLLPLKINLSANKIGFERIPHAAQVYELMRSLQRGKA